MQKIIKTIFTIFSLISSLTFSNTVRGQQILCYRALEKEIRISTSCLSLLEVSIKEEEAAEISLYGYVIGDRIECKSQDLLKSIREIFRNRVDSSDEDGPFMSESLDFLISDPEGRMLYLVSREARLKRLLITPVIDLGNIIVCSGSSKVVTGDSDLMNITTNWIQDCPAENTD